MLSNFLKNTDPKIFSQIHPTLNEGIDIKYLTRNSRKYMWWICEFCGGDFLTVVCLRTEGYFHKECPRKRKNIRHTTQSFIEKLKQVHGTEKFDLSKVKFGTLRDHVTIICNFCKFEFTKRSDSMFKISIGCPECLKKYGAPNKRTQADFLEQAVEKHGTEKYDFSKIIYKGSLNQVEIFCKKCEISFSVMAGNFLRDENSCRNCRNKMISLTNTKTQEDFLEKCSSIERIDKIDFSKAIYVHSLQKITLICKVHNFEYEQLTWNLCRNDNGCSICRNENYGSIPSQYCCEYLQSKNIEFQCEKSLPILPNRRFDFSFNYNGKKWIIEIDGLQHFKITNMWHKDKEDFLNAQKIDIQKNKAAILSGYLMVRISKQDYRSISNFLDEVLQYEEEGDGLNFFYDSEKKYKHMF